MNYRVLGNTGIQVSEKGFGCMSLSGNSETESINLINNAIDGGINYFDTADIYDDGENEKLLGKAISGKRKKVILATKVGNVIKPGGGNGFDWNPTKKHILRSIEGSLQRLKTDYIDLYQLHGGTIDDPVDETIEAFEILKQQGKILHYGISSIRPNVIREYLRRSKIVSVMMQYSYLDRRPEEEILDLLHKNGISVLARGSLAQGLLVDKAAREYLEYSKEEVASAQSILKGLGKSEKNDTASAIAYVLHHKVVSCAVVGMRTVAQLSGALSGRYEISAIDYQKLQKAVSPLKYRQHR